MQPSQYPSRTLVVVSGMSPQVLTETVYALVRDKTAPFIPTQVHLISTVTGARHARLNLLEGHAHFLHLCEDYGLDPGMFPAANIHTITDAQGNGLEDIRTPADNDAAADFITNFIRDVTADEQSAVHVSMAGGRKTMGYYAGYALSLYGRDQDRLSHVLVAEGFEGHRDFYYPTPQSRPIYRQDRPTLDAAEASVDLALIPFVRMRDELPERIRSKNPLLDGRSGFSAAIAAAEQARHPQVMRLDMQQLQFTLGERSLQPLGGPNLSLLCWLAWRQAHGQAAVDIADVLHNGKTLGQEYARFCEHLHEQDERLTRAERETGQPGERRLPELTKGIEALRSVGFHDRNALDHRLSRLSRDLAKLLGNRLGLYFTPRNFGPRGKARYALEDFEQRFEVILPEGLDA